MAVTVVEATDRPMARSLSPEMSAFFRGAHERQDVRFVFGATVVRVLGAEGGRATGVETADGRRFPADLVLVGIGVVPNAELAAEAGLAVADGIVVDEHLATSDPAISAIGDCARYPCRFAAPGAGPTRLESVQNAVDQGRCVAARLAGRPAPYAAVPWFWSDQGALKLQIAGLATPHERAVVRGDPAAGGAFSVFCFRGDRLIGVESVNRPLDHVLARKLLASGTDLTPEQAADPGFDLKAHAGGGRRRRAAGGVGQGGTRRMRTQVGIVGAGPAGLHALAPAAPPRHRVRRAREPPARRHRGNHPRRHPRTEHRGPDGGDRRRRAPEARGRRPPRHDPPLRRPRTTASTSKS